MLKFSSSKYLTMFLGMFFCFSAGAQMGDCLVEASWSGAPTETICSGDTIVLFNTSSNADSWTWTIQDNQFVDADSVVFVTSELGGFSVELIAQDAEGCSATTSAQFLVQGIESVAINAQGLVELCDGSSSQITAVGTYDQYLWSTGGEENTIFVNETTEVYLTVWDLETGCSATSDTANVIVYPDPDPTIVVDGNTTLCPGDSVILSTQEYESYEWNLGGDSQSLTVTTAGFFVVDVVNEFGCGSQSNLVQVQMLTAPEPQLSYEGTTVFCADSLFSTTLMADTSWSAIEWSDGSTGLELDVISSDSYWYCVEGENGCWGCSDTIQFVTLEPTTIEVVDVLDITDGECNGLIDLDVISSFEPLFYAWELNGNALSETTSDVTDLCDGGDYNLTITDIAGCSVEWDTTLSIVTSVVEIDAKLMVYPNPAVECIHLRNLSSGYYKIVSLDGKIAQEGMSENHRISVVDLGPGVYFLTIDGYTPLRFMKE